MTKRALSLAALFALPAAAHAHTGEGATHGFLHGLEHPVFGMDHLLAMVAVGIWAAQVGGSARWLVPGTFLAVMGLGGALGMAGVALPMIEPGISASVLLLGLLVAFAVRLPLAASMALVGVFAVFHGHAHGAEMPVDASGVTYAAGFLLATAGLHVAGIAFGELVQRAATEKLVRAAGVAIAAAGAWLALA